MCINAEGKRKKGNQKKQENKLNNLIERQFQCEFNDIYRKNTHINKTRNINEMPNSMITIMICIKEIIT